MSAAGLVGERSPAELLRERCVAVAEHLRQALAEPLAPCPLPDPGRRRFVVTGTGAAEGPARVLTTLLQRACVHACFLPLSAFAHGAPQGPFDTLVVFSQALSPNARLALARRRAFAGTVLVTAAGADDGPPEVALLLGELAREGGWLVRHAPKAEPGLLLRVVGPALGCLTAMRLAEQIGLRAGAQPLLGGTAAVPAAVASAPARAEAAAAGLPSGWLDGRVALLSSGGYGELCQGLRWKLLEGLLIPEPPQWDALQVVHGPFQQFFAGPITLIALERPDEPGEAELWARLGGVLQPGRHRLLRLPAALPGALALLDHDAQLNQLLLRALEERPRDLARWPGQGCDSALYDFPVP